MEYEFHNIIGQSKFMSEEIVKYFKEKDLLWENIHIVESRRRKNHPNNNFIFVQDCPKGMLVSIKARQKTEEEKYRECLDKWINNLL